MVAAPPPAKAVRSGAPPVVEKADFARADFGKADFIWVRKSENVLMLVKDFQIIRSYPIALGFAPKGHKQREGDGRTPEGLYYIEGRNPKSKYYLSLLLSYPNARDRHRARMRNDDPGGEIMIHGEPNQLKVGQVLARNWTQGCIAVSNRDMRELWSAIDDGTPVWIDP